MLFDTEPCSLFCSFFFICLSLPYYCLKHTIVWILLYFFHSFLPSLLLLALIISFLIFSYLFLSILSLSLSFSLLSTLLSFLPFSPFLFFSLLFFSFLFFSFLFYSLLFFSFLFFFFLPLPHHSIRILIMFINSLTLNLFRIR